MVSRHTTSRNVKIFVHPKVPLAHPTIPADTCSDHPASQKTIPTKTLPDAIPTSSWPPHEISPILITSTTPVQITDIHIPV